MTARHLIVADSAATLAVRGATVAPAKDEPAAKKPSHIDLPTGYQPRASRPAAATTCSSARS